MKLKSRITVEGMKQALGREPVSDDMQELARELSTMRSRAGSRAEQELAALLRRTKDRP